jgi:hypothetical protein
MTMNRFFALMAFLMFTLTLALSGCSNKCDELKDVCEKCQDATAKLGCTAVANAGNNDLCKAGITTYELAGCK